MDAITFIATPRGTDQSDVTALLACFETVPDGRKRRDVRYPLAVLLAIAVLAKLCGDSQVHALADWAHARAEELAKGSAARSGKVGQSALDVQLSAEDLAALEEPYTPHPILGH